nr:hypothetical protein [Tanacetum cinerariifolium]
MIWRGTSLRYGTSKEKLNEVDFISQRVELVSRKISNNNKSLSEIQLEHEREDEFVVVVEIVSRILEEEAVIHFRKEHKEGDGGSKVREFDDLNNGKGSITWQSMMWMKKDAKDGLAKQGNDILRM